MKLGGYFFIQPDSKTFQNGQGVANLHPDVGQGQGYTPYNTYS